MKPDIKQAWLTALRSGDYQQGQGYLRQGDQYCCLGVLCDLYGKAVGPEWEATDKAVDLEWGAADDDVHAMHGTESSLPFEVRKWADLEDSNPLDLITHNDNGSTFEELANIIEEGL